MLAGIDIEHAIKSSVFEESTNLFIPFYRQTSMKHGAEVFQKDGNIDAALISIPYGDYSIFYNNIKDNVAKRIAAYNAKW